MPSPNWSATDAVLDSAVQQGAVPCVVATAADRDGTIYEHAAGVHTVGGNEPVDADTTFRIMSMTKMVTTAAALQLVEQGKLDLHAPIADYCPQFADVQVLEGFDGDIPRVRKPHDQATVHHLVTHTTGLGYWFWNADLVRWEELTGTPNVLSGSKVVFTAPMTADPGTKFEYGISTDWLGQVVESAAGTTLDQVFKDNITDPLGMSSTTYSPTDEQRSATVPIHMPGDDGNWVATDVDHPKNPEYWPGGHGLYSTPNDYLRFQRMLLRGGELDGTRILSEQTVRQAFTNQIGDLDFPPLIKTAHPASSDDFKAGPGWKWGHGLILNTDDVDGGRAAGSGGWAGLCNTHFWVDPTTGVTGAIYSQTLPFVTAGAWAMYQDYERALYAALREAA